MGYIRSNISHTENFGCNNLVSYKVATRLKIPCRPCDEKCIESDSHSAIYTMYDAGHCQWYGEFKTIIPLWF